jgi:2'-5' RNA ligase
MNEHQQRLFIAIEVPVKVKTNLAALQTKLQSALPERAVTWTKPEHLHLTLKFLGNFDVSRIDDLSDRLDHVCQEFPTLKLRAAGVGTFPNLRLPRVIWAGLTDSGGQLIALQHGIEAAASEFTREEPDKNFHAHVTLGRAKHFTRSQLKLASHSLAEVAETSFGEWVATDVELIQSQLSSQGPKHTTIRKFSLQN